MGHVNTYVAFAVLPKGRIDTPRLSSPCLASPLLSRGIYGCRCCPCAWRSGRRICKMDELEAESVSGSVSTETFAFRLSSHVTSFCNENCWTKIKHCSIMQFRVRSPECDKLKFYSILQTFHPQREWWSMEQLCI